jgi:hypothetical protein
MHTAALRGKGLGGRRAPLRPRGRRRPPLAPSAAGPGRDGARAAAGPRRGRGHLLGLPPATADSRGRCLSTRTPHASARTPPTPGAGLRRSQRRCSTPPGPSPRCCTRARAGAGADRGAAAAARDRGGRGRGPPPSRAAAVRLCCPSPWTLDQFRLRGLSDAVPGGVGAATPAPARVAYPAEPESARSSGAAALDAAGAAWTISGSRELRVQALRLVKRAGRPQGDGMHDAEVPVGDR